MVLMFNLIYNTCSYSYPIRMDVYFVCVLSILLKGKNTQKGAYPLHIPPPHTQINDCIYNCLVCGNRFLGPNDNVASPNNILCILSLNVVGLKLTKCHLSFACSHLMRALDSYSSPIPTRSHNNYYNYPTPQSKLSPTQHLFL